MSSNKKRTRVEVELNEEMGIAEIKEQEGETRKKSRRMVKVEQYTKESEEKEMIIEEDKSSFGQFMKHWEEEAHKNGLLEDFLVQWDKLDPDNDVKFFFINQLSTQFMFVKEKLSTLSQETGKVEDESKLTSDACVIDTKNMTEVSKKDLLDYIHLPFPVVSFFVDAKHMDFMPRECFVPFQYNVDPDAVPKYTFSDPENGKVAYHPYFMWIDKFSLLLLRTGDFCAFFNIGKRRKDAPEDDHVLVGGFSHMNLFMWIDRYPTANLPDYALAQEQRQWAVEGAFQLLHSRYQEHLEKKKKQETTIEEMKDD